MREWNLVYRLSDPVVSTEGWGGEGSLILTVCLGVTSENRRFSSFIFHSTQLFFFVCFCFYSSICIWVPHNTWLYFMWFCLFSLGREDPLEKEMATHSSILDWRIPWMEEPGGLQSTGLQRVGHNWATSLHFVCLERKESLLSLKQGLDLFLFFRFRWRSLLHFAEDRSFWGRTLLLPGFRWVNKYYNPKTAPCVLMNISASFRTLPSKACAFSKYYTLWWASSWQAATFTRG